MARRDENTGFICAHCGTEVQPLKNGSYRNHCPSCLYSKHLDIFPGDRGSGCLGLMEPIGLKYAKKGCQIIHKCRSCGIIKANKVADDPVQPDDVEELARLPFMELLKR